MMQLQVPQRLWSLAGGSSGSVAAKTNSAHAADAREAIDLSCWDGGKTWMVDAEPKVTPSAGPAGGCALQVDPKLNLADATWGLDSVPCSDNLILGCSKGTSRYASY